MTLRSIKPKYLLLGAVALGAATLVACETNETLGRSQFLLVDNKDLEPTALQGWAEMMKTAKLSNDATLIRRVRTVGAKIVTAAGYNAAEWEYVVFQNDQPNAFVIPGNKVGVNSGLFKVVKNDDQLAAVLGHETAHVIGKHAAERASQQQAAAIGLSVAQGATSGRAQQIIANYGGMGAQLGLLLPYSRKHELEADRIGVDIMAKAGYKPSEAVALWRNMQAQGGAGTPEFVSTHPSDTTRINQLDAYIKSKGYN
ncbi:M48 family metallopeptidase [Asticcacaulis sp. BYS171W]|uniref:M48 family metallopeptidase n=1 Tax=Asticcacaulis aquaticus TaxID=2984212 RepID=A0ABT5HUY3_9CAUL|nr:M48 family metallopeptidase [Asticcacaulis aquaticus]MDC7683880.1 M48 family metallopeptidase [Asticcacaulis aquaticus]